MDQLIMTTDLFDPNDHLYAENFALMSFMIIRNFQDSTFIKDSKTAN